MCCGLAGCRRPTFLSHTFCCPPPSFQLERFMGPAVSGIKAGGGGGVGRGGGEEGHVTNSLRSTCGFGNGVLKSRCLADDARGSSSSCYPHLLQGTSPKCPFVPRSGHPAMKLYSLKMRVARQKETAFGAQKACVSSLWPNSFVSRARCIWIWASVSSLTTRRSHVPRNKREAWPMADGYSWLGLAPWEERVAYFDRNKYVLLQWKWDFICFLLKVASLRYKFTYRTLHPLKMCKSMFLVYYIINFLKIVIKISVT